ncbi:cobalamin biosynthesis protein CobW [Pseudovibrio ascidiaceicola]|uniref:Cobalamin biosynthesis protein CobW n=1 Tax=Pseudovibrio ascidiaceicola TaxID=285279 RepID=A0A1I4BTB4_9HYPH|nr:cobalamin biosynthesis protein CobW [Pseudovibrio ascidiaceicola]SFK72044.1 cobalamin biosynthesis protein CobW [Pseudovibrio ascidiaceicola]
MTVSFAAPSKKIPAVIITGFLGAGKTTLVRNLLMKAQDKRIALIVNEFGEMGFDGSLVNGCADPDCSADEVVELANGCICCTVADDFLPTMEMLLEREQVPDVVVIETSGLALPQPLVRAFNWPSVKPRVTVDSVVTVVDAPAVAAGKVASDEEAVAAQRAADDALDHESPVEELFADQLTCADLVVLSKADLLTEAELAAVKQTIRGRVRDGVEIVSASHGELALDVLLGRDAGAEDDMDLRLSHHEAQHAHDHDHDHDHHHEHSHDDFESFVLPVRRFASLEEVKAQVETAMKVSGVLRIKGSVVVDGKTAPVLVQAVGPRVEAWFAAGSESHSKLVVIGLAGLDKHSVQAALSEFELVKR